MSELYHVERLEKHDWQRLRALRMRSVADAPAAFGASLESMKARPDDFWSGQVESMACFVVCRLTQEGKDDIGLVRAAYDPESIEQVWLLGMWVDPISRGQALGERLGRAVLDWARQIDEVSVVKLEVFNNNRPAIDLYERLGFKAVGHAQGQSAGQPQEVEYHYLL